VIYFSSPQRPVRLWDSPKLLTNGYRERFPPGVKGAGREADHSHPSSAQVKNAWSYISTPQWELMPLCLIKQEAHHGVVLS
jgi:hypothetical protein